MSFEDKNSKPVSTETQLTDWGSKERNKPPMRPGNFPDLVDRMVRRTNVTEPAKPLFRPVIAWGGAGLIAATVGIAAVSGRSPGNNVGPGYTSQPVQQTTIAPNADAVYTQSSFGGLADRGDNLSAMATPVFTTDAYNPANYLGKRTYATVPIVVTLQNKGEAFSGNIIVTSGTGGTNSSPRTYIYPITVAGGGVTTRKTVYAGMTSSMGRRFCNVELKTPTRRIPLYSFENRNYGIDRSQHSLAILDTRLGVLAVRRGVHADFGVQQQNYYANPVAAPDRASGYDAIDTLVLGKGTEKLNNAQWQAIEDWVTRGGSLVFLEKGPGAKALSHAIAQKMTPLTAEGKAKANTRTLAYTPLEHRSTLQWRNDISGQYDLQPLVPTTNGSVYQSNGATYHSATPLALVAPQADTRTDYENTMTAVTQNYGIGQVTVIRFDPTSSEFRSKAKSMAMLWNRISNITGSTLSASTVRAMGIEDPWALPFNAVQNSIPEKANPFQMALPPLRQMVYVFLGYFVLVIPVSFVVLKQTRRLHYAWFTGPALAVVFAGGVGLMTMRLYTTPTSLRTAGILTLKAGENQARFNGYTEIYTPLGGSYTLKLPGVEKNIDDQAPVDNGTSRGLPQNGNLGSVMTTDNTTGESPVVMNVSNLSFRRIYHQETVSLGAGITATLRMEDDGSISGTIQNDTQVTLHDAYVFAYEMRRWFRPGNSTAEISVSDQPSRYFLGEIKPGINVINASTSNYTNNQFWSQNPLKCPMSYLPNAEVSIPLLTANIDGERFGPQGIGKSIGGDKSVGVLVRLPALTETPVSRVKGGIAR